MKILIIVDAQNDFITGALASREAQSAVPHIVRLIKSYENCGEPYFIIFTQDTHFEETYLKSPEGRNLPILHCIMGTEGWEVADELKNAITNSERVTFIQKNHFGTTRLSHLIADGDEVEVCGFATDICVISNILTIKSHCPNNPIKLNEACCAGTTPVNHAAAIAVMKSCQIEVYHED